MIKFVTAALLVAAVPAFAAPDAARLFADGKYTAAIATGTRESTAKGLLYAGRARLQVASYSVADKAQAMTMIKAALADFDAALAKAPNDVDIQLNRAIAQGYIAKLDRSPSGAKAMRKALDAILARHPDNALAWAALGGWNGGAIATLGSFIAGTVIGASKKGMVQGFDKAMAFDPQNPAHPVYYALTLLDIDTGNAAQSKALLTRASPLPARDSFEGLLQEGGAKVLVLLNAGDIKGAQALARRSMPFGTVK